MKKKSLGLLACVGFVALLCGPSQVLAQNISLGSAANFAVLGGTTGVINTGPTVVTGAVGVPPAAPVTGFPPGIVTAGTIHLGDSVAVQAKNDLLAAYNDAKGRACPAANNLTGKILGQTQLSLGPGVYCFDTSVQLNATLTLDGPGLYIFQVGTTRLFFFPVRNVLTLERGTP